LFYGDDFGSQFLPRNGFKKLAASKRIADRAIQTGRSVISQATYAGYKVLQRLAENVLGSLHGTERDVDGKIQTPTRYISGEAQSARHGCDNRLKKTVATTAVIAAAVFVIVTIIATRLVWHFLFGINIFSNPSSSPALQSRRGP